MTTQKRSTDSELNKEVSKIQQPIPAEKQMQADPSPVKLDEPAPVPQPALKTATAEETATNLEKQAGYDPKANQPTKEEKADFEASEKRAKGK